MLTMTRKTFHLLVVLVMIMAAVVPYTAHAFEHSDGDTISSVDEIDETVDVVEVVEVVEAVEGTDEAEAVDEMDTEDSASSAQIAAAPATIQNYPKPSIYAASSVFSLKADNQTVPVLSYMPDYDYAHFSFDGTVSLEVTVNEPITSYSISPLAKKIQGTVSGNKLTFSLSTSTYVIVEINGARKRIVIAADPLETNIPPSSGAGIYNVTQSPYNADRTGASMATTAIQRAIDDANQAGGGVVFIPAGIYTIGNLTLKSNVTFYLAGGAVIVGTGKGEDYRNDFRKDSRNADGTYFIRTAVNSNNITVRGRGTIDGKGIAMRERRMPAPNKNEGFLNNLLVPIATSNFNFDGLILRDSGFWSFMVVRSDNVTIKNLKGFQDLYKIENDVIDINESQNVLVQHSIAISDDDTYSTKTWLQTGMSKDWPGQLEHLENVVFDDAFAWTRCVAFKIGQGVAQAQIGVTIRNSYVYQSARALLIDHGYTLNTLPQEGYADNITFDNIDIERVEINQFGNYWLGISTSTSGDVSNVVVKNINIRQLGGQQSRLSGNVTRGGMVRDVTFSDVYVKGQLATSLNDLKINVANANVQNVVFANSKPRLFSDDFEDGDTAGWTTVAGGWTVPTVGANNVLSSGSQTNTSMITAGSSGSWTDYAYEAEVRVPYVNANAGLVFRVMNANNYYLYRINAATQTLELYKSIQGQLTLAASTPFAAKEKQWYKLKAIVQGNTIAGYVDGQLKMQWSNPVAQLTSGGVGFRTTSAGVHFDDAVVSPINYAPSNIALSHNTVVENTTAGGMVGTFSTTDADAGDTFTYKLIAGAGSSDNSSFTISDNRLILAVTPDYETKNSYSIRVRSIDSGGLYYDKNFAIQVTDVSEPPPPSNHTVTAFSANFEAGTTTGWTPASGSWSVKTDGTQVMTQTATATAFITAGSTWTDYTYQAEVKMPIVNANAGILLRVQDADNYYMYRINGTAQTLELYKSVNQVLTLVSSTPFTAQANQWYELKAIVKGNTIKAYVNGALRTEWTNPVAELTTGKIGFRTTSANISFDNAVVRTSS